MWYKISFSAETKTAPKLGQQQKQHNMHFPVRIHPQGKPELRQWIQIADCDMASLLSLNIEIPLKSSCMFHLCEKDEAEWLLCLCNLWSGLGCSVNMLQHNTALLCPAMVWVSATITSVVGGWVKDWKMFYKSVMKKILAARILSDKSRQKHGWAQRTQASIKVKLTEPENIWKPENCWWVWRNFVIW